MTVQGLIPRGGDEEVELPQWTERGFVVVHLEIWYY